MARTSNRKAFPTTLGYTPTFTIARANTMQARTTLCPWDPMDARVATMTSRAGINPSVRPPRRDAFTLIELIIVMALLAIVIALGAPRLARFFHGQTVAAEGQRLLALTRYGQSRAASEGLPMILWMNPAIGTYDLRVQDGFSAGGAMAPAGTRKDESYKLGAGHLWRGSAEFELNHDIPVTH